MKYIYLIVFTLSVQSVCAQLKSDLPFLEHLMSKGNFNEVIHLIDKDSLKYNRQQQDSIHYYKGWACYSLKNLEQSTIALTKVGITSPFYLKSQFFAGYNQIFLGNYTEAKKIIDRIIVPDSTISSLGAFELCGMNMLQGNWSGAKGQIQMVKSDIATLNQQVATLNQMIQSCERHRPKSPFWAGLMSAVIPGTGKIYAGKTGEGIASMIATTGFGLITWENYRKLGIGHAKTIFFGAVFAANYVSNIYGSVVSVKIIENEYHDATKNQILFQLHIPLRNFFE
jgi:TM2 domain-containing membrane protein YozV